MHPQLVSNQQISADPWQICRVEGMIAATWPWAFRDQVQTVPRARVTSQMISNGAPETQLSPHLAVNE